MDVTTQDQIKAYQKFQEHVARYFKAVYGEDYVYRAPETFPNMLERWMLYSARPTKASERIAETTMTEIETHMKSLKET